MTSDHDRVQDAGLFLTLFLLAGLLPSAAESLPPGLVVGQFALVLMLHAWLSICNGAFGRWRTVTWVALNICMVGAVAAGFLSYVLPWGQIAYWLATTLVSVPWIGPALARAVGDPASSFFQVVFGVIALALLMADIAVMHWPRWRARLGKLLLLAAGAFASALLAGLALAPSVSDKAPPVGFDYAIIPEWYLLPFYTLLRAVPDKLLGVVVLFVATALPITWPWVRADRLRATFPWTWLAVCLGLAAVWILLGVLGSLEADATNLAASQLLIVVYFAFFIGAPFAAHRIGDRKCNTGP